MRVAQVSSTLSRTAGGIYPVVRDLGLELARKGIDVHWFAGDDAHAVEDARDIPAARLSLLRQAGPRAFGYLPRLSNELGAFDPHVVHAHGMWMFPSLSTLRWTRRTGRALVVSPHGMLDPWAMRNSRLKKSLAWALYQRDQLRNAQCLHALNRAEYDAIRKVGLANPVCVIPNGVHVPELDSRQIRRAGRRAFLFLGRLHPKKNVHSLIAAWAHLYANTESARSWSLLIAGDGPPEYVDELRRLASQLATDARPTFLGHVSGNEKTALLNEGPIMILPSHSEGLPMAVLESFSFGNAVLLSRDSNFPEAVQSGAALEIGTGVDDIAAGLRTAIDLPEERLLAMGAKGRELVMARYSWDRVASDFACVYQWLHDKTARPHCLVD